MYFLGGKGGRCVTLTTLPPSCAVVMKYENRNFLEPSGPLQACNGTALPLPFYLIYVPPCLTIKNYLFCPNVFVRSLMDFRRNNGYLSIQHQHISFYNRGRKCLLRGTDWTFKSHRFVLEELNLISESSVEFTVPRAILLV